MLWLRSWTMGKAVGTAKLAPCLSLLGHLLSVLALDGVSASPMPEQVLQSSPETNQLSGLTGSRHMSSVIIHAVAPMDSNMSNTEAMAGDDDNDGDGDGLANVTLTKDMSNSRLDMDMFSDVLASRVPHRICRAPGRICADNVTYKCGADLVARRTQHSCRRPCSFAGYFMHHGERVCQDKRSKRPCTRRLNYRPGFCQCVRCRNGRVKYFIM